MGKRLGPGPGRPKGLKNRQTVEIKAVIDQMVAYAEEHREEILDRVLKTNPALFLSFLARIAPKSLYVQTENRMPVIVRLPVVETGETLGPYASSSARPE